MESMFVKATIKLSKDQVEKLEQEVGFSIDNDSDLEQAISILIEVSM